MAEDKSSGYNCYSDHASSSGNHLVTHFQTFEPPPEIYNMTAAAMDITGFPSKNLGDSLWKGFGNHHHDGGDPSSSMEPTSSEFYHQHDFNKKHDLPLISAATTLMESSSLYQNQSYHESRYDDLFTNCHDQRPSKGLSLSLSSSNPSTIALQSFQQVNIHHQQQGHIRNSRYLIPAQDLLNEFCSIGTKQTDLNKTKTHTEEDENDLTKQSLFDLQRRKTKLLHMLEEVDRRYKHYCDQMKAVTSSFESVAGDGAARVYSALASQAMSRHFRCLRDGIVAQIKGTKKAMGEKDVSVTGTMKGETPRLRLLDQTLRQQKALQQMSLMESHPWRPQRGLPERSVSVLRAWLFEHFLHPYPSDVDKHILARQTGLSRSQVSNWFINARVRLWKPMVEEMYIEELKEDGAVLQNQNLPIHEDQKPTHNQLVRIDSECLSSIINNPEKNDQNASFGRVGDSYGAMELDFGGGRGGVSLTLGLHQNGGGGGGVSLAFTTAAQSSMFEECQTVQYSSLLDNESQTLPYRNLMGAQLLHDLAG